MSSYWDGSKVAFGHEESTSSPNRNDRQNAYKWILTVSLERSFTYDDEIDLKRKAHITTHTLQSSRGLRRVLWLQCQCNTKHLGSCMQTPQGTEDEEEYKFNRMVLLVKVVPSPLSDPSGRPVVPETNTSKSLYKWKKSISSIGIRVWMSGTQKFARILISNTPSKVGLLVSSRQSLAAVGQSRGSHISRLPDTMASSNIQGKGGTKNLHWKEKPKTVMQTAQVGGIPASKSVNSTMGSIDSNSPGMTVNVGTRASSGSGDGFRAAKSISPASPVNASPAGGKAQQKTLRVESAVNSTESLTDSKSSGLAIHVDSGPSTGSMDSFRVSKTGGHASSVNFVSDPLLSPGGKGQSGQRTVWVAKGYTTYSGSNNREAGESPVAAISESSISSLGHINASEGGGGQMTGALMGPNAGMVLNSSNAVEEGQSLRSPFEGNFTVDKRSFAQSQIRATFYPKFENEKSDQEIRTKMIEMVSLGKAALEVSLKHSGSLFMYAGHEGGAYAKNSYGNIYTAVGVFVLGRMLQESWGTQATKKQKEFNDFLQKNHMCISMELVTAVLGDHGQRPLQDYVVVTAITELGVGKPRFYSTPDIIAFCRKWRLPTNHVWLFSTRKSVTSFFAAYDALCEEGTATPVCRALDEIADISVPGTKDHVEVQGEILEGLVARIVNHQSTVHLQKVLEEIPPPPLPEDVTGTHDIGPGLREICAANRSSEQQQIKSLLKSVGMAMCPDYSDWFGSEIADMQSKGSDRSLVVKFAQSHPADYSTSKLQEMIHLMRQKRFPADFKCRYNFRKIPYSSSDSAHFKMIIHIYNDSGFRRYQKEMREHPGLWPLYRGFFVDVNLFKVPAEKAIQMSVDKSLLLDNMESNFGARLFEHDGLADEAENLMIKLKFLTYKLRTFLIRNGLSTLFRHGPTAYKEYYMRQLKNWGTSQGKQKELSKMLDEWAVYIRRKRGGRQLPSSTYLTEAEPFLEQYARRSPQNQVLIGSAGTLIKTEDFLVAGERGLAEEDDFVPEDEQLPTTAAPEGADKLPKAQGMIVFFPGIPGCAKSALCKEIESAPGGLGDDRPVHSLMGDLIKGRYWQKVADERKKRPNEITLADKNAPNEEVWKQIEDMSRSTKAIAVPVVPDSKGTDTNPFSLDDLAVFIFRVLQRTNHPGSLDKKSANAGYVLLMFYNLYEGKSRSEFEAELRERFGLLVKMPLLKIDRDPIPNSVKGILEEGLSLYRFHTNKHGRLDCTKGSYAKDWSSWEKRLRQILFGNAEYLNAIQVPFKDVVIHVLEELRAIAKGEYEVQITEKRKLSTIVFASVCFILDEVKTLLDKIVDVDLRAKGFLNDNDVKSTLNNAHVTLAHKRSHGVTAVASYGVFRGQQVPVQFTALLFSDRLAALEARIGCIGEEKVSSKNEWPHLTIWTGAGATPKEANSLPKLVSEGRATRIEFREPFTLTGVIDFF
eukprot:Gb_26327 [translate_table: standard]